MASNKTYTVVKDGEELEQLKTLAAAKKLADAEGAEVYSDGKCVYQGIVAAVEEKTTESGDAKTREQGERKTTKPEEEIATPVTEARVEKTEEARADKEPEKFRIKALMNIRKAPGMNGEKAGTANRGDIVLVNEVIDDWMHLADGTFILYGGGEWAERIS